MFLRPYCGRAYAALALVAFGGLVTAGCGPREVESYGVYPPPGVMRVNTVAELEGPEEARLVKNGSFEDWLAGAPAPHGDFSAPTSNPARSTIQIERQAVARGEQALRQTWSLSDWGEPFDRLFGVTVEGLSPNTRYRFKTQVNTLGTGTAYVVIAQRQESAAFAPVGEIELDPTAEFQEYEFVFDSGGATNVRIATLGPADPTAYPVSVVFDNWSLTETEDPATPPVPPAGTANLISNGTFENWPVGATRPPGPFQAPQRHAAIARETKDTGTGRYAARQIWIDRDSIWDDAILFGPGLKLKPMTRYRLSLKAKTVGESNALVEAYTLDAEGRHLPIAASMINVRTDPAWQDYTGEFDTGELEDVVLRTTCFRMAEGVDKNVVLWDDWSLEELGPRAELPVPDPPAGSLIPNHSFEVWYAGRPVPEGGFIAPSEAAAHSLLAPVLRTAADGAVCMRQSWSARDAGDQAEDLFGIQVAGLKRDTRYRFSCKRYPLAKATQQIYIYGVASGGRLQRIERLEIGDASTLYTWEDCADEFGTSSYTAVKIAVVGPASPSAYPFEVLWDDWRLEEIEN